MAEAQKTASYQYSKLPPQFHSIYEIDSHYKQSILLKALCQSLDLMIKQNFIRKDVAAAIFSEACTQLRIALETFATQHLPDVYLKGTLKLYRQYRRSWTMFVNPSVLSLLEKAGSKRSQRVGKVLINRRAGLVSAEASSTEDIPGRSAFMGPLSLIKSLRKVTPTLNSEALSNRGIGGLAVSKNELLNEDEQLGFEDYNGLLFPENEGSGFEIENSLLERDLAIFKSEKKMEESNKDDEADTLGSTLLHEAGESSIPQKTANNTNNLNSQRHLQHNSSSQDSPSPPLKSQLLAKNGAEKPAESSSSSAKKSVPISSENESFSSTAMGTREDYSYTIKSEAVIIPSHISSGEIQVLNDSESQEIDSFKVKNEEEATHAESSSIRCKSRENVCTQASSYDDIENDFYIKLELMDATFWKERRSLLASASSVRTGSSEGKSPNGLKQRYQGNKANGKGSAMDSMQKRRKF